MTEDDRMRSMWTWWALPLKWYCYIANNNNPFPAEPTTIQLIKKLATVQDLPEEIRRVSYFYSVLNVYTWK